MNYAEAFEIPIPEGGGVMCELKEKGDSRVEWRRGNEVEVEIARAAFKTARAKGYMAFRITRDNRPGEILAEFDPTAEKIILSPPLAGG